VQTELGPVPVRTPRDRQGSFDPKLMASPDPGGGPGRADLLGSTPAGWVCATSRTTSGDLYGVEIKRDTISRVTDAVLEDVAAWRTRPLEAVCAIAYFDCLMIKVREHRSVRTRACYLVIGVTVDRDREVLGIWWQDGSIAGRGRDCDDRVRAAAPLHGGCCLSTSRRIRAHDALVSQSFVRRSR
jgi:putative transposase